MIYRTLTLTLIQVFNCEVLAYPLSHSHGTRLLALQQQVVLITITQCYAQYGSPQDI